MSKRAGLYIPIPNCIVCSPGNNLKMVLILRGKVFFQDKGVVVGRKLGFWNWWRWSLAGWARCSFPRFIPCSQSHASQTIESDLRKELLLCPKFRTSETAYEVFY